MSYIHTMDQNIFGGSKPDKSAAPSADIVSQVNNANRRIRMVEESVSNIRRKIDLDETNSLREERGLHAQVKTAFEELDEMKAQIRKFSEDMQSIISELQTMARKDEVKTLQRYIDLWDPTSFVTTRNVKSIVKDALDERAESQDYYEPQQVADVAQPTPTSEKEDIYSDSYAHSEKSADEQEQPKEEDQEVVEEEPEVTSKKPDETKSSRNYKSQSLKDIL
ncbi:MAG: hypothetical protein ACI8Y7_000170 [Candidatus Woesearchaeota archaeon]|jgi:hypothetical protein